MVAAMGKYKINIVFLIHILIFKLKKLQNTTSHHIKQHLSLCRCEICSRKNNLCYLLDFGRQ